MVINYPTRIISRNESTSYNALLATLCHQIHERSSSYLHTILDAQRSSVCRWFMHAGIDFHSAVVFETQVNGVIEE